MPAIDERYLDAISGMRDKAADHAETDDVVSYDDHKTEERVKRRLAGLGDMKSRRQVYRQIALEAPRKRLPHGPCRYLCRLLDWADRDLDNCFPRLDTLAAVMGVSRDVAEWNVGRLVTLGWVARHEFYRQHDGRQSSSGIQFRIPRGSFGNRHPWLGPAGFEKHQGQGKRRKMRIRDASAPVLRT
jgi:hypothetical protein